jgi:hypothetical protein
MDASESPPLYLFPAVALCWRWCTPLAVGSVVAIVSGNFAALRRCWAPWVLPLPAMTHDAFAAPLALSRARRDRADTILTRSFVMPRSV